MLHRFAFLAALLASLIFSHTVLAQDATVVRRAAFDIGSAAIKCTVADVDIPTGRIVEIVETMSEKVDFAEDLDTSYDSNLSEDVMAAGIEILTKMKLTATELEAAEFSAAGGAAFRKARNGRAYFVRIEHEAGIPSRVISEQQAATLSFHAVKQVMHDLKSPLLVWDIGGGSQQMTARSADGGLLFYLDTIASVTFKNVVIEQIQKKNTAMESSPNPISPDEVALAMTYIKAHAAVAVPTDLTAMLRDSGVTVAGIGGVHYYAIPELLGGRYEHFTRDQVAESLKSWTGKTDEDFDDEYASTRLTNLILVLGYMDALGIDKVHPLKINQADGLLTAREFW